MIRKATPADIDRLVPLIIEALRADRFPSLLVSTDRIRKMAMECISSPQHFAWVCEKDGELQGSVAAMTVPGFWFERSSAQVVMCYCKSKGEGISLLRKLIRWYKSRPMLKRMEFTCEFDADPRLMKLIELLGFDQAFPVYTMIR